MKLEKKKLIVILTFYQSNLCYFKGSIFTTGIAQSLPIKIKISYNVYYKKLFIIIIYVYT